MRVMEDMKNLSRKSEYMFGSKTADVVIAIICFASIGAMIGSAV